MHVEPKCRQCGGSMENGSIYSARWIRWLPEDEKPPRAHGQLNHEALVGVSWRSFRPPTAAARRCTTCRIVEFDY